MACHEFGLLLESEGGAEVLEQALVRSPQRRRPGGAVAGLLVLAGLAAFAGGHLAAPLMTASTRGATQFGEEAAAVCTSPGENCAETKCCMDGGETGLQCYMKDQKWGECFDVGKCETGVHKGETEFTWNAQGQKEFAAWVCNETGKPSKPGCETFGKKTCAEDRCFWKTDACKAVCVAFTGPQACWDSGYCMWDGGKCQDACWEVAEEDKCGKVDRCMWLNVENGSKCTLACHIHGGEEDCPHEERCIWEDDACKKDPCSAPWEDCRQTNCCSIARGGVGMTCTEKNKDYATCLEKFDPKYQKDWSGEKLGNRTKFPAGCNWAGTSCANTHTCCNEGFNCNRKDEDYIGCVQAMESSTWVKKAVDLPAGWDGTNYGGWRGEYEVEPVAEGGDMAGTSFYCIMAILPNSSEDGLLAVAKKNNASIFGCDAHSVYHSWRTDGAAWDTGETTVINTDVFLKVFKWVKADGLYLQHDWTIKVDADCVFLPQRLREHIWGLRPPPDQAIFLKNNDLAGLGNNGFLGAIEVFSKKAMQVYLDNDDECGQYLGTNSGEDGFFLGCMIALGTGCMWDRQMFEPNFDPMICTNGGHAAYHPIKYPSHWQRCWDIATGKMCEGLTYDCGGDLDPPVTSAGVR